VRYKIADIAARSAPHTAASPARSMLSDASRLPGQKTPASASTDPIHSSPPHAADQGAPMAACTTLGSCAAIIRSSPHAAHEASRPTSTG